MTVDSKESALARWSRRKLEARQAEATPAEAIDIEAAPDEPGVDAADTPGEQPVLTDADMPDIESLSDDADFSPFMSPGVSDELRNLALRKLFRAPVFNLRDGLDEYDEDYTSFEKLGNIVTADMKHQIEMQQQKLREKLAAEDETETPAAEADAIGEDIVEDIGDASAELRWSVRKREESPCEELGRLQLVIGERVDDTRPLLGVVKAADRRHATVTSRHDAQVLRAPRRLEA